MRNAYLIREEKMSSFHQPVLLQEVIDAFTPTAGRSFIDATGGGGGHTQALLKNGGRILTIDWDEDATRYIKTTLQQEGRELLRERYDEILDIYIWEYSHITLVRGNFQNIKKIAHACGFRMVSGVLFDLGVSSHQLDTRERGFSFQQNGPLDMRMDKRLTVEAKDLVNALSQKELVDLLRRFGEEYNATRIAKSIVAARRLQPIQTTGDLTDILKRYPATLVFQALRIAVNDELGNISLALPQAYELLDKKGRIVIIAFHSLEDRIVKETFIRFEKEEKGRIITKKPIVVSETEVNKNRRSRSAKMRIFEKN